MSTKDEIARDSVYARRVAVGEGGKRMESLCLMGTETHFEMMKTFWSWLVVMASQQCEYLMPLNGVLKKTKMAKFWWILPH